MANPTIKKAYTETFHGQIHYRYALPVPRTAVKAPMIFLHKSASSSASFTKLISHYVSLGHPCYAPDMPGFGQSFDPAPAAEGCYDLDWFCSVEAEFLRNLGFLKEGSERVHLVGHHSGAAIAPRLAVLYPQYIASVVLDGPTVLTLEERMKWKAGIEAFNRPVLDGSHFLRTWNAMIDGSKGQLSLEELQRETLDHVRACEGRIRIYTAIFDFDGLQNFRNVKCPVLALCARDDVLWESFRRVKDVRSDVKTGVVEGANFSVDLDVEGVVREIDGFWRELGL